MVRSASDPYVGALLGLACGDALGAPAEFLKRAELEARHGRLTEMVGGGNFGWAQGRRMAAFAVYGRFARPWQPTRSKGGGR
jgi:ADP-ribosylglycohydrolase